MSTADTAQRAVFDWAIQATGWERMCRRTPASSIGPKMGSYIHFHIWAETTVGIAQGTSMTARITPLPLKLELTTSAMIRPRTNSKETVMRVNFTVTVIEWRKASSWMSRR